MTDTFNLKDLSLSIAEQFGLTAQFSSDISRFVVDKIIDNLVDGKQVRLHKFGTLQAHARKERMSRNPKTGAPVVVPTHRVLKLNVSPLLKEKLGR